MAAKAYSIGRSVALSQRMIDLLQELKSLFLATKETWQLDTGVLKDSKRAKEQRRKDIRPQKRSAGWGRIRWT